MRVVWDIVDIILGVLINQHKIMFGYRGVPEVLRICNFKSRGPSRDWGCPDVFAFPRIQNMRDISKEGFWPGLRYLLIMRCFDRTKFLARADLSDTRLVCLPCHLLGILPQRILATIFAYLINSGSLRTLWVQKFWL